MPGSNPLFGLNALGGAISINTKNGFDNPGTRAEALAGSWGRVGLQAETGGSVDDTLQLLRHGIVSRRGRLARLLADRGEADVREPRHEERRAIARRELHVRRHGSRRQRRRSRGTCSRSTARRSSRARTGRRTACPWSMCAARKECRDTVSLTGNVYLRDSDVSTLNGDDSDFEECVGTPGFICEQEGGNEEVVLDENGLADRSRRRPRRRHGKPHDHEAAERRLRSASGLHGEA